MDVFLNVGNFGEMTNPSDENLDNDFDLQHNDFIIKFIFITKILPQDVAGCERPRLANSPAFVQSGAGGYEAEVTPR